MIGKLLLSIIVLVIAIFVISYEGQQVERKDVRLTNGNAGSNIVTSTDSALTYSIIDSQVATGIKRSLTVRLSRKVTMTELRRLAQDMTDDGKEYFDRTFIAYYLPGMVVGEGAWAVAQFGPELDVKIYGVSIEKERELISPAPMKSGVIGRWLDDGIAGSRLVILRENNKLYLDRTYSEGGMSRVELRESKTASGRRFDKVDGSKWGDHYLINRTGDLEIRDDQGLIVTARKLK